ncbi:MAG TPA: glucokinase [Thermoanaerobaculia bacterium]|jgi:glucokinase|nr:glucokinase [Thermoanaerobaculia bacterium]
MAGRAVVLAGDVGGTKSNLGLFEVEAGLPRLLRSARFASADHPGLAPMLEEFLGDDARQVRAACFGVPGPVIENRTSTTNLAWELDGAELARVIGGHALVLINDLVATAEGIPLLTETELAILHRGVPGTAGSGNVALIAAGTGLGMALMPRIGGGGGAWVAVPSEGGHMDFAPRSEEEIGLLTHLQERFGGHVSVERVVSGPGLFNIYEYLRDRAGLPENPRVRQALDSGEDPSKVIGEAALSEDQEKACGLCSRAVGLFVSAYGAAAGNLALVGTATGGLYLGGGIAPKLLPRLLDGHFLHAFFDKGRFRNFLEAVPVRVILNDRAALLGAARHAASLLA